MYRILKAKRSCPLQQVNEFNGFRILGQSLQKQIKANIKSETINSVVPEIININDIVLIKGLLISERDLQNIKLIRKS